MKNLSLKKATEKLGVILLMNLMVISISCKQNTKEDDSAAQTEIDTTITKMLEVEPRAFTGGIRSIGNTGPDLSGEIAMRVEGDLMRFDVTAEGLSRDMEHMQYLLVSQSGDETQCPGNVEELTNIEATKGSTATSRTTLRRIPLHTGGNLDLESDSYPRTNINGELQFSHIISLDSLRKLVRNEYQMQELDFSKFTYVIRGIPDQQSSTTQVRGGSSRVPNTPVGCAKLMETVISN